MYKNLDYHNGLERARKCAIRAIKRNDLGRMDDTFKEIIEMCIQLRNLQKAVEIKKELISYLK